MRRPADGELTVLESFPVPRPSTNPYLVMLGDSLRAVPGVEVLNFSWKTAMLGRYDVFHAHWPEILVGGRRSLKKAVRQGLTAALLLRLRIKRIPIVRTVHNIDMPDGISTLERRLLTSFDRQTTLRIRLNVLTELDESKPVVTIPHGHYREWFAAYQVEAPTPGRIGYVGLIRRYKGVESLLSAFVETKSSAAAGSVRTPEALAGAAAPDAADALSLRIGGKPSTDELADTLRSLAAGDPRVSLHLAFLSDAELVTIVTESELVVLPYRFMHNSGGTLAALSLNRPVLVPDNEVNALLSDEVGDGWVQRFSGDLTSAELLAALDRAQNAERSARPNLDARNWDRAGTDHVAAFREAITVIRAGR